MGMIRDLLGNIDPNTMVLGLLFIILLVLINFSLMKFFKKEKTTPTIISLCVSLLAVYGISRTNFDLTGLIYGIGISEETLYLIVPLLILIFLALLFWKVGLSRTFICLGIILIILSFTPLIYEKSTVLIIGGILVVLGSLIWLFKNRRNKKKGILNSPGENNSPRTRNPSNNQDFQRQERRKQEEENRRKEEEKRQESQRAQEQENKKQKGLDFLANAARRFKRWAIDTGNPRFNGSWAMFINWLGKGGYGRTEREICERLGITRHDFVRIFNKYGKP